MEKLASQHRIINNIFDYGDEVLYYVTFKEGGKSRINNNIFSLTITQVNTKKNRYQLLDIQICMLLKSKEIVLTGRSMKKILKKQLEVMDKSNLKEVDELIEKYHKRTKKTF